MVIDVLVATPGRMFDLISQGAIGFNEDQVIWCWMRQI